MARQQIEVFEKDYETLLRRAGSPNKIAFVVRNLVELSEAFDKDQRKLAAWNGAAENPLLPL